MRESSAIFNRAFAPGYTLKQLDPALKIFKAVYINQVSRRKPMLSDQNRFLVATKLGEQFGRFPLQGCYKFSSHEVILK